MPLATERELCFGCSSEGEGWVLSKQEEKKCLIAFGLTNNYIDLPCDTSWDFMFRSNVITSDQRQTWSISYSDPHGQKTLRTHLTAASHGASATPPDRAQFSIKTLAESQVSSS